VTGRRTHQGTTFAGWRSRPRPRTRPRERSNPAPQGLAAGRTPTRASQDIDVLGNLITSSNALRTAVAVVRDLGFEPEPSMDGKRLHRFVRTKDNQAIDILAPDHSPPGWKPTTVPPLQTIQIAGGNLQTCESSPSPKATAPPTYPCQASWDPSS
jgi:hypothetical protein